MTKTTPSDLRPQTSDFIFVKDFIQDSSLDFEHLRCDPQLNPPKKRGIRAHFGQGFLLKIIFLVACRQEILEEIFM